MRGSSSQPFLRHCSLVLLAAAPDLGRGVTPLGRWPSCMWTSWLLPLTSDVGWLLSAPLSLPVAAACTQYASKFGMLSSGHRPGKGQFSFQSQRKAMPKNVQTTAQLSILWHCPSLGLE